LREGDDYDSALAQETERNLRSLGVFGSVLVTPHFVSDSLVDLVVETSDQWTTEGSLALRGGGGAYQFSLGLEEKNLLGLGQKLELIYEETDLRVSRSASFYERRLFSWPISLSLVAESRTDGDYYLIETGRSLYSSRDKWGGRLSLLTFSDRVRFFAGGEERFFFPQKTDEAALSFQRSWGNLFKRVAALGYSITQNNFRGPTYLTAGDTVFRPEDFGFVVPEERVHSVSSSFSMYSNRYTKEKYLDNFGIVEDFRLGETSTFQYVLAPRFLGSSVTRHEAAFSLGTTRKLNNHFIRLSLGDRSTFLFDRWEGNFWQANLRHYWRWKNKWPLAFRLEGSFVNGQARIGQFVLGGENGLRGYDARQFTGSRMVLGTIEQRIFGPNLLSILGIGGVTFIDFGQAWKRGEDFRISEVRSNWGLGLRLGLVKSSSFKVMRLDMARPFGPGGWVFSFGTGMSFELE